MERMFGLVAIEADRTCVLFGRDTKLDIRLEHAFYGFHAIERMFYAASQR